VTVPLKTARHGALLGPNGRCDCLLRRGGRNLREGSGDGAVAAPWRTRFGGPEMQGREPPRFAP